MAARLALGFLVTILVAGACAGETEQNAGSTDEVSTTTSEVESDTTTASTADSTTDVQPDDQAEEGAGSDSAAAESTDNGTVDVAEPDDEPEATDDRAEPSDGADDGTTTEATVADNETIATQSETAEQLASDWIILHPSDPGDSSPDVQAMQERLDELGFAPGSPDGSYGAKTERALEAFQGLVDLPETGVADSATMVALSEYTYDGLLLRSGDEGQSVEDLQQRLADGPFDPGTIDGEYGTATTQAVWALEKLAGVPVDGNWGPLDELAWAKLEEGTIGGPTQDHPDRWVEVDLSEQLAKVYDPGQPTPALVVHISSGSGIPWENEEYSGSSVTPKGDFSIDRRINGWRESSLNIGRLYNPLYFNGGIAFHGATSVPLYPASHGCVRLPMHIAEYLPGELPNGTNVHILT